MDADSGEVTRLLRAMNAGDRAASEKLLPLVYHELHRIASAFMRRERPDHTLQATALIHEAYLRLAGDRVGQYSVHSQKSQQQCRDTKA